MGLRCGRLPCCQPILHSWGQLEQELRFSPCCFAAASGFLLFPVMTLLCPLSCCPFSLFTISSFPFCVRQRALIFSWHSSLHAIQNSRVGRPQQFANQIDNFTATHRQNQIRFLISCLVDYHNKKRFVVRTSVRSILRTEVRTTNESCCGQLMGHDIN